MIQHCTRLAPSPTGALHLGNIRTFLVNWALARQRGWRVILRIEDLDGPRVKQGADRQLIDTLQWLGLDWDEGPYYQSYNLRPYSEALRQLAAQGDVYPCRCTRSEILEASVSAPHGDHELRYSGTCRPEEPISYNWEEDTSGYVGWRLRVPAGEVVIEDQFAATTTCNLEHSTGDFLVATKGGTPSYQLAVVVDDARQSVDRIVRGDDLLASVPRQSLIYDRLGLTNLPQYWHLPLVVGEDGRRLAKRHGDTRIDSYRAAGVRPTRLVGLIARWSGLPSAEELGAQEFASSFSLANLPKQQIIFTHEHHNWLLGG